MNYLEYNVLFTLIRTKHSSETLLHLVRINVNKTLDETSLNLRGYRDPSKMGKVGMYWRKAGRKSR